LLINDWSPLQVAAAAGQIGVLNLMIDFLHSCRSHNNDHQEKEKCNRLLDDLCDYDNWKPTIRTELKKILQTNDGQQTIANQTRFHHNQIVPQASSTAIRMTQHFADGARFDGEMKGGIRNGKGVYIWNKAEVRYDGSWKEDVPHGQGSMDLIGVGRYVGKMEARQSAWVRTTSIHENWKHVQWALGKKIK